MEPAHSRKRDADAMRLNATMIFDGVADDPDSVRG
jgi:hypothetical protein